MNKHEQSFSHQCLPWSVCLGVMWTLPFCHYSVVVATFTLKSGFRNFRFRRLLCGNLTVRRRAEHHQRSSGDAVLRYRPEESQTGPAGPPSLHGGGPERAVRWYGRGPRPGNLPQKPVQTASPEEGMLGDGEPASERHVEPLLIPGEPHWWRAPAF